jgi:F0F1-type ATP synthase assembly protein I
LKLSSAIVKLNDIGIMILLDVFSSPIAFGAQTFLTIVCVLVGLGAGISAIDVRSTFSKKK